MRTDPAARQGYADTKRLLAEQDWPTMNHYADAKSDIIEDLIARALSKP